jgi:HAE1 family hydrophobic/amphiphilic exporter-1
MFSKIFIERPRLAAVISIIITLAGIIAIYNIPIAEFPDITPPVVRVQAAYPGANAQVVQDTVAAPIEQEVNGVDNMIYMESESSNNGSYSLSVTFEVGTNPDINQVNVQNRLQLAESQLPQEVLDQGIDVRKRSTDMLGVVAFTSPNATHDRLFLSNYISKTIKDALVRVNGVSDVFIFGELEYSMRIWTNPDKMTAKNISENDLINAIRRQNIQATLGSIGTSPALPGQQIQFALRSKGRLLEPEEFENIIIRTNDQGGLVRVKDIARVELGAKDYFTEATLDNKPAIGVAVYRATEANALETMTGVEAELERQREFMPADIDYEVIYDTTDYVVETINEIVFTLFFTFLLVVMVIFIFLQDWRATLIPTAAIPVSIIGTFAALLAMGYSANTITLFALILSIGLVVDDAIVVVENVHRLMEEEKLDPKQAAVKAMSQVSGPIIATTLVLLAVFVPIAFMPGITGQLYKQFGVTICISVVLSAINSLTLSPALCGVFLRQPKIIKHGPLKWFNTYMDWSKREYSRMVAWFIRHLSIAMLIFILIIASIGLLSKIIPTSFLPLEDKGGFFNDVKLPEGASIERTKEIIKEVTNTLLKIDGVEHTLGVSGFSLLSGQSENVGFAIGNLKPWDERKKPSQHINAIINKANNEFISITTANIISFSPPPIQGLGTTGGFDFRLEAMESQNPQELYSAAIALVTTANNDPSLNRVYTTYSANTPQIFVELDRARVESLGVPVANIFATLQQQLGSYYINDFNLSGRTYQVKIQADANNRKSLVDIEKLYAQNSQGKKVPMDSLVSLSTIIDPQLIKRYNLFPSVTINGEASPGFSSGQAMNKMEEIAKKTLPKGYTYEWSSMSYQERQASGTVVYLFALALIFSYLFLVGQYESWNIPLSVMLSVLVATFGGLIGILLTGLSLSIYAQIGVVLLVGLAAKNAILIVEFAKDRKSEGLSTYDAAIEGAVIRFRPVLMTALTFVIGVAPLVIATGAGAASRRHIGTTVFFGMIAATTIGIIIIPTLYYLFQNIRDRAHEIKNKKDMKKKDESDK